MTALADTQDAPNNERAPLIVRRLGRAEYVPVWRRMQAFTDDRDESTADELWLVEHPPVFTLGQAGRMSHVLAPGEIPVVQCDRGGQVTYHGPGQLVAYPLLDLRRRRFGTRELVRRLEEAIIRVLADYAIAGERREGAPGVYVDARKIASIGLRVRDGCTYHGLAFNVHMDLGPFSLIDPCGYKGLEVTQVSELGGPTAPERVADDLVAALAAQLQYRVSQGPAD